MTGLGLLGGPYFSHTSFANLLLQRVAAANDDARKRFPTLVGSCGRGPRTSVTFPEPESCSPVHSDPTLRHYARILRRGYILASSFTAGAAEYQKAIWIFVRRQQGLDPRAQSGIAAQAWSKKRPSSDDVLSAPHETVLLLHRQPNR